MLPSDSTKLLSVYSAWHRTLGTECCIRQKPIPARLTGRKTGQTSKLILYLLWSWWVGEATGLWEAPNKEFGFLQEALET